ncbi:hypothetical protein [Peribacillus frigoritolerans]|uniref:hypothetical protein n=1 Tax=Peribacillus frigoritolerans TaxID=450367 RepID=UPI0020C16818|nr:hypothetical protein [Peribacillus frigoritolerans]
MNSYYYRLTNNKKTKFIVICIVAIVIIDIFILIGNVLESWIMPHLATFLAASSLGHMMQILLIWFLPIFLLIMCADSYIQDYKTGYRYIVATKKGRYSYYKTMLLGNMSFAFLVMVGCLLLNMIIAYFVFMNGEFDMGLSPDLSPENPLYTFNNKMPAVTNVVYIIIFGFYTSLCAGMATVLSWCFPDIKYTYPLSFVIWFSQILGLNYSLAMIIQPFNEVTLEAFILIFFRSTILFLAVITVGFMYKVKSDEV